MRQRYAVVLLAVLACVAGLASPAMAQAPENVRLAALDIAVWPEYDQPAVLVIYRAQIAVDVSLPANVFMRIPANVAGGKPHAVAVEDPTVPDPAQRLLNLPYTVDAQGDWLLVSFTTAYRVFQVEFYDVLDMTRPERRYTLTWPGDMGVDNATLQIQEPFGASEFQATPALGPGQRRDDGLIYHPASLGSLPAGQMMAIELAYRKGDSRTSVEALSLAASVPPSRSIPGPLPALAWPGWLIVGIIVGVGLIIAGVVWCVYARWGGKPTVRRDTAGAGRHAVPRSLRSPRRRSGVKSAVANFCTQCGHPLGAADIFCPRCKTRRGEQA